MSIDLSDEGLLGVLVAARDARATAQEMVDRLIRFCVIHTTIPITVIAERAGVSRNTLYLKYNAGCRVDPDQLTLEVVDD